MISPIPNQPVYPEYVCKRHGDLRLVLGQTVRSSGYNRSMLLQGNESIGNRSETDHPDDQMTKPRKHRWQSQTNQERSKETIKWTANPLHRATKFTLQGTIVGMNKQSLLIRRKAIFPRLPYERKLRSSRVPRISVSNLHLHHLRSSRKITQLTIASSIQDLK